MQLQEGPGWTVDLEDAPVFKKYRCHLRSAPGMWACYQGHVDVFSPTESEVFRRAVHQLAHSSFPDRPSLESWVLEHIDRIPI